MGNGSRRGAQTRRDEEKVGAEADAFDAIVADLDGPAYVVTTAAAGERDGCLVALASQCSIDPPRFGVWLSKENRTYRIALSAPTLVVHLLRQGDHHLAHLFGAQTGDEVDKFEGIEWRPGPDGCPVLARCDWFAGSIIERPLTPGQFVQGDNTPLLTIVDLSTVWVMLDVFESDIHRVRPGQRVDVTANAYPDLAEGFAQLRQNLGARTEPTLVIVTRSGNLGPAKPGLDGPIVARTGTHQRGEPYGAEVSEVIDLGGSGGVARDLVDEHRGRGFSRVLTEGGPQLMGEFLGARVVDELFLTVSPFVFGSTFGDIVGIADGAAFDGDRPVRSALSSVRREGSHLFLRYSIDNGE